MMGIVICGMIFTLLNKYWTGRHYPVYLANNVRQPEYQGVPVINYGEEAQ